MSKIGPTPCPRLPVHLPHFLVPGIASFPGPRYCLIPWSQVLPHSLVPGTASYSVPRCCLILWSQVLPLFLVPDTASFSDPRYCLILGSQVPPHFLAPGTASFAGPRYCLMFWSQENKVAQAHNSTHMRAKNFSTTAPGPKFRDLQVSKNPSGPSQGPNRGLISRAYFGAQSGPFWGPRLGYFGPKGGLLFSGGLLFTCSGYPIWCCLWR